MQSMQTEITVTVPPGAIPGQMATVVLADGTQMVAKIPPDLKAGQQFNVFVASGTPVPTTNAPEPVSTSVPRRYKYHGNGPREGAAASCCIIFLGFVVLLLSILLLSTITEYFNMFCRSCQACYYSGYCYPTTCCQDGAVSTQPISVDALPHNADGHSGDGVPDNWSLIVACTSGVIGSLISMCSVMPPTLARGGAASMIAGGSFIGMLCHVAVVVCLGVQMISSRDQWVYNAFCGNISSGHATHCTETYHYAIDTSLASYWYHDASYFWFGVLVYWLFSLSCVVVFFELVYIGVAIFGDEKYTGTRRSSRESGSYWY